MAQWTQVKKKSNHFFCPSISEIKMVLYVLDDDDEEEDDDDKDSIGGQKFQMLSGYLADCVTNNNLLNEYAA